MLGLGRGRGGGRRRGDGRGDAMSVAEAGTETVRGREALAERGLAELQELREEARRRGWYGRPTGRLLLDLAGFLALAAAGAAVFLFADGLFVRLCGLALSTGASIGVATFTHTASHNAIARRQWANEALTYFGYTFFWGLSANYWWHKHVAVHHPAPNVFGVDDDADFSPWLALTQREVAASTGWKRVYYSRFQHWTFPLLLAVMGFGMQSAAWGHLLGALRDPARRSRKHWIDLGVLILHLAVWIGLPMLFFPAWNVIGFYALRISLMGFCVFAVSAPGHIPAYAIFIEPDEESRDFLLRQTATTANFTVGRLGRWLCSGLEYQIEHHLFPGICHRYYPELSPEVRELCRRLGLPYHVYGWDRALAMCFAVMARPKRIEPSLEAARLPLGTGGAAG